MNFKIIRIKKINLIILKNRAFLHFILKINKQKKFFYNIKKIKKMKLN